MTAAANAAGAVVLACLTGPGAPAQPVTAWTELLAPEVSLRTVPPDGAEIAGLAGPTPYALLGAGALGPTAVELAVRLAAEGRGPSALVLCRCPPPEVVEPLGLSCPVLVVAGTGSAHDLARWQAVAGTGGFTLRLTGGGVPPHGPASPDLALALKEELRVWPH